MAEMERIRCYISRLASVAVISAFLFSSCGPGRKIEAVRQQELSAVLALSRNEIKEERGVIAVTRRDTLTIRDTDGKKLLIMKAVKDNDTGEMVATDVLDAAVITARFRNVAERHGKIDLRFEIIVPASMQDSHWQLRFHPDMFILEDSLRLESVFVTGEDYRKKQIRGYELYNRFLSRIITDSMAFVNLRNVEIFIQRNLEELYQLKCDSSFVSEEHAAAFESYWGLHEKEVIEHYTNRFAWRYNEKRKERKSSMFARYVKAPIVTEGIRLDTVLRSSNGDFVYHYTQTISTRPRLRKVDIVLSGDIYEADQRIYSMQRTPPLTFYISSLSAFVDGTERYLSHVVERQVSANTACYVDFETGKSQINPDLGYNRTELGRIRRNLSELLDNRQLEMDSIVIAASASPEGNEKANIALSGKRAAAVADYFGQYIRHYRDSVRRNEGLMLTVDDSGREKLSREKTTFPEIRFLSRSNGENWDFLSLLVDQDTLLSPSDVRSYMRHLSEEDPDRREAALQREPYYRYLREKLYPRLRTVRFDFYLHRKGMLKDTVHTTVLDSVYMKGVAALRDRDYRKALDYLRDYKDYNTAIAYVSLDYNASAMAILQKLRRTPQVNYMLALLYARSEDDQNAVQCYLDACREDRSFIFRGNLDPEIYTLIQRYGLNKQDDEEWEPPL